VHPQLYRQDSEQVTKPSNQNTVTTSTIKPQNRINPEKRNKNKEDSYQLPSDQSSGSAEPSKQFCYVLFTRMIIFFALIIIKCEEYRRL
jgi:hypothetical protein